jgi:hypothetical protein
MWLGWLATASAPKARWEFRCTPCARYTPFAFEKAAEWAGAKPQFARRAGFALMAGLAVKAWLLLTAEAVSDERNMWVVNPRVNTRPLG